MTEERKNIEFEDIEALLKPQCEFHASENVKQEVMERAEKSLKPRRLRYAVWAVAACVAGVVMIILTPPKSVTEKSGEAKAVAKVVVKKAVSAQTAEAVQVQTEPKAEPKTIVARASSAKRRPEMVSGENLPAGNDAIAVPVAQPMADKAMTACSAEAEQKPKVLREAELPITRPENLRYTPEEIELMKKQAREAYEKWLQLELEIIRNESQGLTQEIEKSIKSDNKNKKI